MFSPIATDMGVGLKTPQLYRVGAYGGQRSNILSHLHFLPGYIWCYLLTMVFYGLLNVGLYKNDRMNVNWILKNGNTQKPVQSQSPRTLIV